MVSEKTVARLMNELGLRAVPKERYVVTTDSNHNYNIYPNLLDQNFEVDEPNTVWVTDITYVWTMEGWLYLASIIDLYSRKVIGWSMADHMRTELTLNALKMALVTRQPNEGLIHHSDRGSQYCANEYIERLDEITADISMSRTGNPYDNACMESFHASIKKEFVYRHRFETKEQAKKGITSYMHFYNEKRRHSTIGYVSPNQFERRRLRLEENRSA
ncbi:IS3 family transposase [Virgibacillus profundi]|nr:IS3 family transposase [Virgibacillus profundi]